MDGTTWEIQSHYAHRPDEQPSEPATDLGDLELRERTDAYGWRLVALYRKDGGRRMSNWVRTR